jgi:superfamily II DNA or RNA helicase
MYVPRYFGIGAYGPPEAVKIGPGDPITITFQGEMRDYQKDIVQKYLKHVGTGGGGLLDVDPGKGKTVMALYILAQLRRKTLVVVHKSFLMNQWIERIEQFLPGARTLCLACCSRFP